MIRRETDAALINRIANSSAVSPFVAYRKGPMDWTPAIEACVVLSNGEDAVGVFEPTGIRVFQVHTLFGESCRGARALEAGRAMIDYMIPNLADEIWGATPIANKAARWFNRRLGAVSIGVDHYAAEGNVELFRLEAR